MDRIIYFYTTGKKKEGAEFSYRKTDYELLRVGLASRFAEQWEQALEETPRCRAEVLFWGSQFDALIGEIKEKLQEKSEGAWERQEEIFFACEDRLLPLLLQGQQGREQKKPQGQKREQRFLKCGWNIWNRLKPPLPDVGALWGQKWQGEYFTCYMEGPWVEHMMEYAVLPYFLILGYHRDLPELLCKRADRIKGVRWILPERVYKRNLQDFAEDFYDEYGIAVGVQLLDSCKDYRTTAFVCKEPVNVLDFSEEEKIPTAGVAEGSVWLDMTSLEEKCRRVEERNQGIRYFSLKKEWKQPVLP